MTSAFIGYDDCPGQRKRPGYCYSAGPFGQCSLQGCTAELSTRSCKGFESPTVQRRRYMVNRAVLSLSRL